MVKKARKVSPCVNFRQASEKNKKVLLCTLSNDDTYQYALFELENNGTISLALRYKNSDPNAFVGKSDTYTCTQNGHITRHHFESVEPFPATNHYSIPQPRYSKLKQQVTAVIQFGQNIELDALKQILKSTVGILESVTPTTPNVSPSRN